MGEEIGIGIAAAGFLLAVAGIIFQLGRISKQVDHNTEDIREIRLTYLKGMADLDIKLALLLQKQNDVCDRVSRIEVGIAK